MAGIKKEALKKTTCPGAGAFGLWGTTQVGVGKKEN